ncbi:hypothetical protein ACWDLG_08450 [Nonomuraea sp. NPDC003727]
MRKIVIGAALAGVFAVAAPVAASASTTTTLTTCSAWKPVGNRYFQSCIDVTGTQVTTYGLVSSAGATAPSDTGVGLTSRDENGGGGRLGRKEGTVHVDNNTVRFDGYTTTVTAGARVRSTVYVPGVIGTGTLVGTDGATFYDSDVPQGPSGPVGPGGYPTPTHQAQITTWVTVAG